MLRPSLEPARISPWHLEVVCDARLELGAQLCHQWSCNDTWPLRRDKLAALRILLCELGHFQGDSLDDQLECAHARFVAWCQQRKIGHSQPVFLPRYAACPDQRTVFMLQGHPENGRGASGEQGLQWPLHPCLVGRHALRCAWSESPERPAASHDCVHATCLHPGRVYQPVMSVLRLVGCLRHCIFRLHYFRHLSKISLVSQEWDGEVLYSDGELPEVSEAWRGHFETCTA